MHHLPHTSFSRRLLLQGMGAGAALSLLNIPLSTLAYAVANGARRLVTGLGAAEQSVGIVDLATGEVRAIPVNMLPHSFVAHPARPDRIWTIERGYDQDESHSFDGVRRYSAAEVDIASGEVRQYINPSEGSRYFGHGFFTPDGATLFISRVDMNTGDAFLTGYDAQGKIVADYPVAKGAVHEIRLLSDGTVMAANSGIKPLPGADNRLAGPRLDTGALLHIDLASGKVLQKQIVEDDAQMVGHFHRMEDDTLILLSRPRAKAKDEPGKVFTGKFGEDALRQVPYTDRVKPGGEGECLSLAVDEKSKRALITNPGNRRILAMDTHEGVFIGEVPVLSSGVAFDPSIGRFIAGNDGLVEIDPATLKTQEWNPQTTNKLQERPFNSAHTLLL